MVISCERLSSDQCDGSSTIVRRVGPIRPVPLFLRTAGDLSDDWVELHGLELELVTTSFNSDCTMQVWHNFPLWRTDAGGRQGSLLVVSMVICGMSC